MNDRELINAVRAVLRLKPLYGPDEPSRYVRMTDDGNRRAPQHSDSLSSGKRFHGTAAGSRYTRVRL